MLRARPFPFPTDNAIRVIVDTDCKCEVDDQYAVAHILMTPRFDVRAVIAEQFCSEGGETSEQQSYDEIVKVVGLMDLAGEVNILHGGRAPLQDEQTPADSEGARFIIEEALRDDPRPLFVCNQGALTNLASALLLEPAIAGRFTAIMIGGAPYPNGGREFNLSNDLHAGNVVFKSKVNLWQVPFNVYTTMQVSYAELMTKVYPYGAIGRYLVENTVETGAVTRAKIVALIERVFSGEFKMPSMQNSQSTADIETTVGGEMWSLGDSPCIGLMLSNRLGSFTVRSAPCAILPDSSYDLSRPGSRDIRVYDSIDSKFILNDMFAKFQLYFG